MSDSDQRLVVIRRFMHEFEADMARSALEAAGIEATVQGDDVAGMYPSLPRIALVVRSNDAARAAEVLDTAPRPAEDEPSDAS